MHNEVGLVLEHKRLLPNFILLLQCFCSAACSINPQAEK